MHLLVAIANSMLFFSINSQKSRGQLRSRFYAKCALGRPAHVGIATERLVAMMPMEYATGQRPQVQGVHVHVQDNSQSSHYVYATVGISIFTHTGGRAGRSCRSYVKTRT